MNIWLLLVLAISVVMISILRWKLHAFLALLLAGLTVASLTDPASLRSHAETLVQRNQLSADEVDGFVDSSPVSRLVGAFGKTAGQIGIVIALASVIGGCLIASGAGQTIVDRSLDIVGMQRAPIALAASSFVLGIPVFFDTVFYLMVPLAQSLCRRSGRDYVLFILAIMAGGSIAHSLVPPTPGPLQVAAILNVDLFSLLIGGLAVGSLSSVVSLAAAYTINRFVDVPLRESQIPSSPVASVSQERKPPLVLSLLPIVIPVLLIGGRAVLVLLQENDHIGPSLSENLLLQRMVDFAIAVGDKNIALGIATAAAFILLRYVPEAKQRREVISRAIESGGVIILITSAGGAFGAVLGQSGITEALTQFDLFSSPALILPMAFLLTAAIRTVQGSATVAMITSAGILQGFAAPELLPFHPVYLAMAIGAGSKPIAWMTDSGFWLMCKMSGMSESEGLKTVSPLTIAMGLSTLFWTMLAAWLFPFD